MLHVLDLYVSSWMDEHLPVRFAQPMHGMPSCQRAGLTVSSVLWIIAMKMGPSFWGEAPFDVLFTKIHQESNLSGGHWRSPNFEITPHFLQIVCRWSVSLSKMPAPAP